MQSIPELFTAATNTSHYTVVGNPGGPFTITFTNAKAAQDISSLIEVIPTGADTPDASVVETAAGQSPLPLASDVQTYINSSILNNIAGGSGTATVVGAAGGPFLIAFGGGLAGYNLPNLVTAGAGLTATVNSVSDWPADGGGNEFQQLTLSGTDGTVARLSFAGVPGDIDTTLTLTAGVSPTAQQVLAHLNTIPTLAGNVAVLGNPGGPFTILFQGAQSLTNVGALSAFAGSTAAVSVAASDGGTILPAEFPAAAGSLPTVGQVQTYLDHIPGLLGNVTAFGTPGGPFTLIYGGALATTSAAALLLTTQTQPTSGLAPVTTSPGSDGPTNNPAIGNEIQTLVFSGCAQLQVNCASACKPAISLSAQAAPRWPPRFRTSWTICLAAEIQS